MDATKVLIGVLVAVVAVFAFVFVAPIAFGQKNFAANFDWERYGHDSSSVCAYTVDSRRLDYSSSADGRKGLVLRVTVPTNTQPKEVKNALIDAMKRAADRDRKLGAMMALAYYPGDRIPADHSFTAGKAVWGPGGAFVYDKADQPYKVAFFEAVRIESPNSTESRSRRGSGGGSGGGAKFGTYCPPPPPSSSGGG